MIHAIYNIHTYAYTYALYSNRVGKCWKRYSHTYRYMQIQSDTCSLIHIQTDIPSRLKIHARYAHTNRYAHDNTSKDRSACIANILGEVHVFACIIYVSEKYRVCISMPFAHICLYCLYLYVPMWPTILAANHTNRYTQYMQIIAADM